jgi:excisionase family DNA binding protein
MKQGLTVEEAAARLGLRVCTVRRWILERRIGYCKIGRRAVRIPAEVVEKLLSQGYRPPVIANGWRDAENTVR